MTRILAACSPGEVRIAVERSGALIDYALWRPGAPDGLGDVLSGVVAQWSDAMGGAFVTLPEGRSGFLPGKTALPDGQRVAVVVTRAAQGGKNLRVALSDRDAGCEMAVLARGPSPLERLATDYPHASILIDGPAVVAMLPPALRVRVERVACAFDEALEAECAALQESVVLLHDGVRATIEPTRALVAIDLDWSGNGGVTRQFAANAAALPALARQIRLRALSGAIVIDPAGLGARKRHALTGPLRAALAAEGGGAECLGATGLGLLEVVRPRVQAPLHERLASPHGIGLAALRAMIRAYGVRPGCSVTLQALPTVIAALQADGRALEEAATALAARLDLVADPQAVRPYWRIDS